MIKKRPILFLFATYKFGLKLLFDIPFTNLWIRISNTAPSGLFSHPLSMDHSFLGFAKCSRSHPFLRKKISKKSFLRLCFVCGIHLENRPMSCKRMKWLKHVKSIRVNIENFPNKWRPLKINVNYSCQLLCVLNFFSCLCLEVSSACIFPMKSYFWALD